jgi:hypothetical protein
MKKLPVTEKNLIDSGFCFDYEAAKVIEILNSKPEFPNMSKFLQAWDKVDEICKVVNRIGLQSTDKIQIPFKGSALIYDDENGWYLET